MSVLMLKKIIDSNGMKEAGNSRERLSLGSLRMQGRF